METTRKDLIAIFLGLVLAGPIALVLVHSQPPKASPVVHLNPVSEESTSTYLVTTTTVTPKDQPVTAKPVKHAVTTTTSEVRPPPLTAEQEAKIPGPEAEADPDADEHLPSGTDYNLPYDSVDKSILAG